MKSFKKLTALLLTLLLVSGIFAVGGIESAAAPRRFFAAKDEAGNYAVYQAALAALGSTSNDNSLISKYYFNTRYANMVALQPEQIAQQEEAKAWLAEHKAEAEGYIATLTVNPGDTFIGNSWFEYTGEELLKEDYVNWQTDFDKNSVAWVNVKFIPGTLQNLDYSYKYNQPERQTPQDTWAVPDTPETELDTDSPWYCLSTYTAKSAGTNVLERSKTTFANETNEYSSNYIYDGETAVMPTYSLGCFGFMTGSPLLTDITNNVELTIPAVNDPNHGAIGYVKKLESTSAAYFYNPVGSYPLLPKLWEQPDLSTTYAYNSDIYKNAGSTYEQNLDAVPTPTYFGALTDSTVVNQLIPIDFACEYDGVNGKGQAEFAGWRIVGINNNPEKRTLWYGAGSGTPYNGCSAGEPYCNYEITLEAQWKPAANNPFPVYEKKAEARTWNWLLERLRRWALDITGALDEFGDPIPYAGNFLRGLMKWLFDFIGWIQQITNVNIQDILESFGLKF